MIPKSVKDRVPEAVKDKIRPPAWRDTNTTPGSAPAAPTFSPDWAKDKYSKALKFVWGDRAFILSSKPELRYGVYVYEDSKGRPLPEPILIPANSEGTMVAVGPDFVVMQFGEGPDAGRYRVPKDDVFNSKPESERRLGRRLGRRRDRRGGLRAAPIGWVEVRAEELA